MPSTQNRTFWLRSHLLMASRLSRQGDDLGVGVDGELDVHEPDFADALGGHVADLHAALLQGHPRIDVGRVIVLVDEDVVALPPVEAGGEVAQRGRSGPDEGDFLGLRLDGVGRQPAGIGDEVGRQARLLVIGQGGQGAGRHRLGHAPGQGAHARVGEVNFVPADREFVLAQLLVGVQFGNRHRREPMAKAG
jgi:hypothetical protein